MHLFSDTFLGARGDGGEDKGTPHQHQGDDYAATLRILAFSIHPKLTIRVEHFPDFFTRGCTMLKLMTFQHGIIVEFLTNICHVIFSSISCNRRPKSLSWALVGIWVAVFCAEKQLLIVSFSLFWGLPDPNFRLGKTEILAKLEGIFEARTMPPSALCR